MGLEIRIISAWDWDWGGGGGGVFQREGLDTFSSKKAYLRTRGSTYTWW